MKYIILYSEHGHFEKHTELLEMEPVIKELKKNIEQNKSGKPQYYQLFRPPMRTMMSKFNDIICYAVAFVTPDDKKMKIFDINLDGFRTKDFTQMNNSVQKLFDL